MSHARFLATLFGFLACWVTSAIAGEGVVTIPLKEIWALDVPGTRDLRKLTDQRPDIAIAERIDRILQVNPTKGNRKGFAVAGEDLAAVKEALARLSDKRAAPESLPSDMEVSLVFFSTPFSYYVHLQSVERRGDVITIKYAFVPHKTKELTAHFAIIPMGKLPVGKWQVKIVQLPMAQEYKAAGFKPVDSKTAREIVCAPFVFETVLPNGVKPDN